MTTYNIASARIQLAQEKKWVVCLQYQYGPLG